MQGIVVIGLGSMGRRRIRLLKSEVDNSQYLIMGVDTSSERREQATREFKIETYDSLERVLKKENVNIQMAIISTSPLSHSTLIRQCLNAGLHVFTELNLVEDGYQENIKLAQQVNKVLFLSSTFLYREEINYIKNLLSERKGIVHYTYHIGQYLPDWHPWENYQNFFVGDNRTNGCREIFAIELPWLQKAFGKIVNVKVQKTKSTNLAINFFDTYQVLLEHSGGTMGALQVDVVSRKAVRNLEIYGENIYLSWDGTPTGLKLYDFENKQDISVKLYENAEHIEGYSSFIIENAYRSELNAFLSEVAGKKQAKYTFEDDLETLCIIDRIES